jgi:hypothetical protein
MTKAKLRRLIELAGWGVEQTSVPEWESRRIEYRALLAEFAAWEPDRVREERDEAQTGTARRTAA